MQFVAVSVRVWIYALLCFCIIRPTLASYGDKDPDFVHCLSLAELECGGTDLIELKALHPDIVYPEYGVRNMTSDLLWTGWTCMDNARYLCMMDVLEMKKKTLFISGKPIEQFYGKWPFIRWYGMQEPASTFASVANMIPHLLYLYAPKWVPVHAIAKNHHMSKLWSAFAVININGVGIDVLISLKLIDIVWICIL
jgi:hypothetical protein